MPQYRITSDWSDPIGLLARDVVQNQGAFLNGGRHQPVLIDTSTVRKSEETRSGAKNCEGASKTRLFRSVPGAADASGAWLSVSHQMP
ncbi:hypothetical protein [Paracoccus sp. (in: a-proteobacteria)]|uniref:hypothetical protein n=1 Tax=Paracoccus sp. TaxID=267 RepID=UPI0028A75137|nr:hypothetical protein [Paracoccus sp. (in: a-proteobacteria)]